MKDTSTQVEWLARCQAGRGSGRVGGGVPVQEQGVQLKCREGWPGKRYPVGSAALLARVSRYEQNTHLICTSAESPLSERDMDKSHSTCALPGGESIPSLINALL